MRKRSNVDFALLAAFDRYTKNTDKHTQHNQIRVLSVSEIYTYFKSYAYRTIVMEQVA